LLALSACGDGAPFVGTVSRSQFFEYHDQVDEPLCPTLLSLLDQHAQTVGGEIGLRLDPSNPFRYYKFSDAQAFYSSEEAGGKAFDGFLFSPAYFDAHEQAHLYTFRAWGGWSTEWLNEGEAVALSCEPTEDPTTTTTPRALIAPSDWRVQLFGDLHTREGYEAAGFVVTHLAQQYGWGRVAELHRRAPPGTSWSDFERVFADVFPLSMDQAWSDALDAPGASACDKTWTCRATPLAIGDDAQPECDGRLYRSLTVGDGEAGIVLDVADGKGITLSGRCADSAAQWYPLPGSADGSPVTHWALVPPGPYNLFPGASGAYFPPNEPAPVNDGEFLPGATAPIDLGLRASVPGGFLAPSCPTAGRLSLDATTTAYLDLTRYYDDVWVGVDGGGASFGVVAVNLFAPLSVSQPLEICDGCGPSATCTALPATSVTLDAGTVLHLQGVSVDRPPAAGQIVFHPTLLTKVGP
jgi:hypothetical protein